MHSGIEIIKLGYLSFCKKNTMGVIVLDEYQEE
jgi:hypothetical protein